ncbi:MAG: hypothetical protein J3Q66DRAFT_333501 [Benniella sp.]|nr:MAG: hypothetical protein J3Q66DRAFT_333501 [Benniella sp.]
MVKLTCLISATVAMVVPLSVAAQQAQCLRLNERFQLQSVSHRTFLVKEQTSVNLMSGPGPLHEPPLVMCATMNPAIPCSANPQPTCIVPQMRLFIRVEFPNGSFGFLWGALGLRTIRVLPSSAVQASQFTLMWNQSYNQTRIQSVASNGMMLQAGSNPDGTLKPILVEPPAFSPPQLFNIVKILT